MNEIQFASVKDAVRWSEEVATIPDIGSMLGNYIGRVSCGRLSKMEIIDIAMTISLITASCKPYKGMCMKAVYAGHDRERDHILALALAARLLTCECREPKTNQQLVALGESTIRAKRSIELYGKRYPMTRMAKDVGVSRDDLCKLVDWIRLRSMASEQVAGWMEAATNEISVELRARDLLA